MVHYLQRIHRINVMAIYGLSDISALEYWLRQERI
ncbi:MAG: hypothetical protein JWQ84_3025 [Mucilaginibacter sp.]|nr:hypothetical protein [Mucilaginibacter sp.]